MTQMGTPTGAESSDGSQGSMGAPASDFALYRPRSGAYDELMTPDGQIRAHWLPFVSSFGALSDDERARGWATASRLLRENGLTYDVPSADETAERPITLDMLPLILPPEEWALIERGLVQRARLMNSVLLDLYGDQSLLREGHLPAAVVLGNPRFHRPCHRAPVRDDIFLQFLSVELGRAPDGRWWVLGHHAELATDIGYALENRIVMSQSFPELFTACHVQRLAAHFYELQNTLIARTRQENPRVVLMTPGPGDPAYFADAYLARYLGYTLAEGADMTVRDGRVHLKTLDGLNPVDLILRRVETAGCDPLELSVESNRGIPGLLQAVRAESVATANGLGSGLIQAPALDAFMPVLCQSLLGETLALNSLATWWCGDEAVRNTCLERLDDLVFLGSGDGLPIPEMLPGRAAPLDDEARERLRARIVESGRDIVAHERMTLSTAPVWGVAGPEPSPMTLTVFVAATQSGYAVMPGGYVRVAPSQHPRLGTLEHSSQVKDAWVTADGPVSTFSLLRSRQQGVELRRTGKDLPSRAADNMFWLGRYIERAEGLMRVLQAGYRRLMEDTLNGHGAEVVEEMLQVVLANNGGPVATATERTSLADGLLSVMTDPHFGHALPQTLNAIVRTAWLARDRLSRDAWYTLNRFNVDTRWRALRTGGFGVTNSEAVDLLAEGILTVAAFSGLEMENMTRNHGWRFLDMGRRIERALVMAELLADVLSTGDVETNGALLVLLELADSTITYRSRYLTTPFLGPVIDLLILDESNPRSIGFQIAALAAHIDALPRDRESPVRSAEQRVILSLQTRVRLLDIKDLIRQTKRGRRPELAAFLREIRDALPALSDALAQSYFSHLTARRPIDLGAPPKA